MFLAYGFDVRPRFGRIGSGAGDLRAGMPNGWRRRSPCVRGGDAQGERMGRLERWAVNEGAVTRWVRIRWDAVPDPADRAAPPAPPDPAAGGGRWAPSWSACSPVS
ncbi:hypothetical protein J2S58_002170 [Nakamurella flavida]|nr:hypothetical protein [Nakamurella flavida]